MLVISILMNTAIPAGSPSSTNISPTKENTGSISSSSKAVQSNALINIGHTLQALRSLASG